MVAIFWISVFIVFYTFIGYGMLLYLLVRVRRLFKKPATSDHAGDLPSLTLIVAAYNEADIIEEKILNSLALAYPGKIEYLFISDGSNDGTDGIISRYPQVKLMHMPIRSGKINAIHRAMGEVGTEIVVFTDANTLLNNEALLKIARHYSLPGVGAVAGEKRVKTKDVSDATVGEGFYWRYESALKKWDSELYSVVGAAGELFSIRSSLYQKVPEDTILDDFMISMLIAAKGYRIIYEPEAYATEDASANVSEELKRKIRIAAGGVQSILRLNKVLNPIAQPMLTFQYVSHRVLRWTVTPFLLILAFVTNLFLAIQMPGMFYSLLLCFQVLFYSTAFTGWLMEQRKIRVKALFIPYYFCVMNYAVLAGMYRYMFSGQSAMWEKAKRKAVSSAVN